MRNARALAGLLLLLRAATVASSAAAAQPHVSVYFLRGEQLARVTRPGTTALDAVRQLIAGPTRGRGRARLSHLRAGGHAGARA